jgi:hypothetical protein
MQISVTEQNAKYFIVFFRQKSNGKCDRAFYITVSRLCNEHVAKRINRFFFRIIPFLFPTKRLYRRIER